MEVLLTKNVAGIGQKNTVCVVKDGYARNYLIPHGLAIPATTNLKKEILEEENKRQIQAETETKDLQDLVEILRKKPLVFVMKANKEGHLFESIRTEDIRNTIEKKYRLSLSAEKIVVQGAIKEIGSHTFQLCVDNSPKKEVELPLSVISEKSV